MSLSSASLNSYFSALGPNADIQKRDDRKFQIEAEKLLEDAEALRLKRMKSHKRRALLATLIGTLCVVAGAAGFGWLFLMETKLDLAVAAMVAGLAPMALLNLWAARPIAAYKRDHKTVIMPRLAEAMGGLKFHPARGISAKVLGKTGVVPAFDDYKAEDCFLGVYKGVKVIFSEARLQLQKKPVFDGVFALLEVPSDLIEGHTIITADKDMVASYATSRWKKMQSVDIKVKNHDWDRFHIVSSQPESAQLLVGERLLKELAEASDIFNKNPITAVLFASKYIFLMIPNEADMFEAASVFASVATKEHTLICKKEIDQILEVIDVFELYQKTPSP